MWFSQNFKFCMHTQTTSGLEKLGFLVNKNLWSSKQVQENVVCLVIFCFLLPYKVKVFPSPGTSLCTKSNRLWKENNEINLGTAIFRIFFLWQYNYTREHHHLFLEGLWVLIFKHVENFHNKSAFYSSYKFTITNLQSYNSGFWSILFQLLKTKYCLH